MLLILYGHAMDFLFNDLIVSWGKFAYSSQTSSISSTVPADRSQLVKYTGPFSQLCIRRDLCVLGTSRYPTMHFTSASGRSSVFWKCVLQSMDLHVCGPVVKRYESFCFVNEKSTVTLTASALNFIWTLQSEKEDGGHCSFERGRSKGLQNQEHPLNFQLTRRSATRNHLGISYLSANRWSFQIQTQILTLHFSYIYRPTRKLGLWHSSKSRLVASGAPIKSHSKIHNWEKKTSHRLTWG